MAAAQPKKTKVLFVCLGNICRSPTAEAVFRKVVEDASLVDQFEIDSCGTGGGSPDWMTRAAIGRGVKLTSRSRPLRPADLVECDYILGMDASNLAAIRRAAEYWKSKHAVPADYDTKVSLMSDYLRDERFAKYGQVPDPYYGGSKGFELVLDLLDDACSGLLEHIQQEQRHKQVA
ncbi:hypothetical protein N2152v2_007544 [Parachlorella kessleri]